MRKLFYLFLIALFVASCSYSSKKQEELIKEMEKSLSQSNKTLNASTNTIFQALNERLSNPYTRYKAETWHPFAEKVMELTQICNERIEQSKLRKELSRTISDSLLLFLKDYEDSVLQQHEIVKEVFEEYQYFNNEDEDNFYDLYFNNSSTKYAALTNIQQKLKLFENKVVTFCLEQCSNNALICTFYTPLLTQNTTTLKKGDTLIITTGIGEMPWFPNSTFDINGEKISVNENNTATYKLRVSNNPGKYSVQAKISYVDQDGKKQIFEKNINYTVAKECDQ